MKNLRKYKLIIGGTSEDKFLRNIQINENGCWIWLGARNDRDYGQICVDKKMIYVHRWAYEFYKGTIRPGMDLDHLCRNHPCCNPAHLEQVTRGENVRRGMSPKIIIARTNMCIHGHSFTPENTYIRKDNGGRVCKKCNATRLMASRIKKNHAVIVRPESGGALRAVPGSGGAGTGTRV